MTNENLLLTDTNPSLACLNNNSSISNNNDTKTISIKPNTNIANTNTNINLSNSNNNESKLNSLKNSIKNKNVNEDDEHNDDNQKSEPDGFFRKAIPTMPKSLAIICCILNIVFPGLGTLISSFSIFFCASHNYNTNIKAFFINILAFILQLSSAIIIFGWIWSIKYGLLFIHLSDKTKDLSIEPDLPLFVRRHSSMDANILYQAKPRLSGIALPKLNEDDDVS